MPLNPSAVTYVFDVAAHILTTAADELQVNGVSPPDRQYVANGEVAHDCEQLVVSVERLVPGAVGRPQIAAVAPGTQLYADIALELVRCVPTQDDNGFAPSPVELQASAKQLLTDNWVLLGALMKGRFSDAYQYEPLLLIDHTRIGPSGGVGGWRLRFSVQL